MKLSRVVSCSLLAFAISCGDKSSQIVPATPTSVPSSSFSSIQVGTAGNVAATLAPGETRQLWAVASTAAGASNDVTNVAVWQSSNPAVAIVTAEGLLKASAEGMTDVSATYQKVTGALHFDVKAVGCVATIDKPRLVFGAFGGYSRLSVTLSKTDCRWTAASDAGWLTLGSLPSVSGDGYLEYQVAGNSTPAPRDGHITIQINGGPTIVHDVSQEKPLGCSYVVTPETRSFPSTGGTGSFEIVTTPADCQWRIGVSTYDPVRITSATTGIGRTTVTYTALANPYNGSYLSTTRITVNGLSGLNPPGVHTVLIAAK